MLPAVGRRFVLLALTASMLAAGDALSVSAGEKYAFLVAVGDYDRKELKPLAFTRSDILELHQLLLDSGYDKSNVVLMHDDSKNAVGRRFTPEAAKIREELKLLLGELEKDDTLIVAFAGHGVQFKEDKQNYFCPADARLDNRKSLISVSEVYEALEKCRARQKLLLVDACRNDPQSALSRSRQSVDLESVTRPQTEAVPEGLIAIFSCAAGQQSFEDPDLKHGVFFYHVLQALNGQADDGDDELTLDELVSFTKKKTQSFARATFGEIQTPQQRGEFTGTWVLRNLKSPSEGTPKKPASPVASKRPVTPPPGTEPPPTAPPSTVPPPTVPPPTSGSKTQPSTEPPAVPAPPAAGGANRKIFSNSIGMEMMLIPAGVYERGGTETDERAYGHEMPRHRVRISQDFYMGLYEVTQGEWMQVMKTSPWRSQNNVKEGRDVAVSWVPWEEAVEFCRKLTIVEGSEYRLPTEAEWEYACRAGTDTIFSFGDSSERLGEYARHGGTFDKGNVEDEQYAGPVGQKKPNKFGLFDMHGNVKEWCSDWHDTSAYVAFEEKVAIDPKGPDNPLPKLVSRIARGGSWRQPDYMLRSSHRDSYAPTYRFSDLGFRVVAKAAATR